MPADLWTDAVRMVGCGLIVAAVAAPVGLTAWVLARRSGTPLLPRPRPGRVPWTGFEVVVAFVALNAVGPVVLRALSQSTFYQDVYGPTFPPDGDRLPVEGAAAVAGASAAVVADDREMRFTAVRGMWAGVLALPIQLGLVGLVRRAAYPAWHPPAEPRSLPARIALAVVGWAVLTPVVLVIHAAVTVAFTALDLSTQDHPLSKLSAARPTIDHVLFFLQAGVAAPVVEEVLFRGVLLAWLIGGQSFLDPLLGSAGRGASRAHDRRVLIVLVIGVLGAAALGGTGATLFAAGLLAGWGVVRAVWRRKRRTVGAVYASATLFAVVHSSVWPTPIPLFALGLGLGWLAVRTRGVLVPAVVHGLFNAVSVLFVLRGG